MIFWKSIKFKFRTRKFSPFLALSSVFLIIALATLIYGVATFMTSGIIDHGDHVHIREAFVLSNEDAITILVGTIFTGIFLVTTIFFALMLFDKELLFVSNFKKSRLGSYLFKKPAANLAFLPHDFATHKEGKNTYQQEALVFIKKEKLSLKETLKHDFFGVSKFTSKSETYKIALTAILLALTLALSFIEVPGIVLPWGSALKFRFFETITLFFAIRMVGVFYALSIATIAPWLHFAAHAIHVPTDILFFMVNNILITLAFYFLYYRIFKAEPVFAYQGFNSSNLTIVNTKNIMLRKVLALGSIIIVGATLEALGVFGSYFLVTGDVTSLQHKFYYDSLNGRDLVSSYNAFLFMMTAITIFAAKYIFEALIFGLMEKRIVFINKQFGIS